MSVFIFSNIISGINGLNKSVINTATLLADNGIDTHIINCIGKDGGFRSIEPSFPMSSNVHMHSIQAMTVSGGNRLFEKQRGAFTIRQPLLTASYTKHDLLVMREINAKIRSCDLIIFTHPLQAVLYEKSVGNDQRRARAILQIHGNYAKEQHNLELLLAGLPCIDDLQIVSESMRAGIKEIVPITDDRIHYIPNIHFPVDFRKKKSEGFNVAIIGSLQDRKNQIDAVKAFLKLENTNVRLDVWGNTNGEYGKFIQLYVNNVGATDRIRFRGIGTEQEMFENTDLLLITSKHEGFGYTMIEAATHRIPTVAYDYEFGASEFILSGVNGYIVPMGNVDNLASRIDGLAANPSLVADMGNRAFETFTEKFSPEYILNLYKTLIPSGEDYGEKFAKSFVRDNHVPFCPKSVKFEKRVLFGWHYADDVTFLPNKNHELDVVRIHTTGKPKKIKLAKRNHHIVATIPRYKKFLRRLPAKYLLATKDKDGRLSYILNTTLNGKVERLPELSRYSIKKDRNFSFASQNVVITNAGPHVKYNSYEPIHSVRDDDGTPIEFKTNILNWKGMNHAPYISYSGEFSALNIRHSSGKTFKIHPPTMSYRDVYMRLFELEKENGFLEFELGGVRPWELMRASLIEQIMTGMGHWGPHFDASAKPAFHYAGSKKISNVPAADRLLFEFPRKGETDVRTQQLRTGNEIVIEYPQAYGYSVDSYIDGPVYPIAEFFGITSKRVTLSSSQRYKKDFFGPIFSNEFGIDLDFRQFVESRVLKFKKEHWFWSKIFDKSQFREVVIPSAYWSAGICHAAKERGMIVSDMQYALITDLHPTNRFTGKATYTPQRIYTWSDYWSKSAEKYNEKLVVPRKLADVKTIDRAFDFCVMSQPRVRRRIFEFLVKLAARFPDKSIAYCLHPDQSFARAKKDTHLRRLTNIEIFHGQTFNVLANSEICIGGYTTSLYEAAYLGKPTYVIPVPGWEVVEQGVKEGIFRVANDPDELVAYVPPVSSKKLF